jgi:hypothetical protein
VPNVSTTSRKRRRRLEFFSKHPRCCFCGGIAPATEEDHFPSRALFLKRAWPEGYAFPACAKCNHVTKRDELIVALLSRIRGGKANPESRGEMHRYFADVRKYFPGLLENMRPKTHREFRNARKKYGLTLQPGQASTDMPILLLTDARIQSAVLNFAHKLGMALYYKHAAKPVPTAGGVALRWYSNLQVEIDAIPRELTDLMPTFPKLERARTSLSDQFFYRIGLVEEKTMGVFLATFREAFAIVGFLGVDATIFAGDTGPMTVRPVYKWT